MLIFLFINLYLVVKKFNVVILTKNFRKVSQNGKLTLEYIIFILQLPCITGKYVVHLWHRTHHSFYFALYDQLVNAE